MKSECNCRLLCLACMLLLTGCIVVPTPTPYPTYTPYPTWTPYPTYTPQPTCTPFAFEEKFEEEFERQTEERMAEFKDGLAGLLVKIGPGDTLSEIAKKYGTNVDDIVSANELSDPSHIYPGQLIIVPLVPGGGEVTPALSKYESTRVSLMCPAGWEISEMEEEVEGLYIWEPSFCSEIRIVWWDWKWEISPTADDRYRELRETAYGELIEHQAGKPEFEILREYRLRDGPVFEFQYWDKEDACVWNVQVMNYIDPESRQFVIADWNVWGCCSTEEWHQWMDFRRALFDTVIQSITFARGTTRAEEGRVLPPAQVVVDPDCCQFDAPGNDNQNKNGEWVCFTNRGGQPANMTGWVAMDETGYSKERTEYRYRFPAFVLPSGSSARLYTGCGTNTANELHMCKTDAYAWWNNDGDTVYLFSEVGGLVAQYAY